MEDKSNKTELNHLYEELDSVDEITNPGRREKIEARINDLENYKPIEDNSIDQGFCLLYKKLSYRRKFLRGIWFFIPLQIYAGYLLLARDFNNFQLVVFAFIEIIILFQLFINYKKWKSGM